MLVIGMRIISCAPPPFQALGPHTLVALEGSECSEAHRPIPVRWRKSFICPFKQQALMLVKVAPRITALCRAKHPTMRNGWMVFGSPVGRARELQDLGSGSAPIRRGKRGFRWNRMIQADTCRTIPAFVPNSIPKVSNP